ncbi:MAG TPA: FHA domain-containing protein [Armatimonadota bacterium]|jgi:hypothetical protein
MDNDFLNIEPEDLDDLELPPVTPPPPTAAGELLVIGSDDLTDLPLPAAKAPSAAARRGEYFGSAPPTLTPGASYGVKSSLGSSAVATWGVLQLALAGALGGFLAWAVVEPFTQDGPKMATDLAGILLEMAVFGACLGGLIGAALGCVEGISTRVPEKLWRGLGWGLLIGGGGGALGGVVGQLLYGGLGAGLRGNLLGQIMLRAIAWGLVGVCVGLSQGAHSGSGRKLVNGLVGGAIGGFVGGLLFDPISMIAQALIGGHGAHAGLASRLIAMTVLGLCSGAAIGLVEELRKEAWLIVVQGPLQGKQFILYRPLTTLGSSPKCDLCLIKDSTLRPQHAVLQQEGQGHVLFSAPESVTLVNGRRVSRQRLTSGDVISLGQTALEYRVKTLPLGPGGGLS